jgi:hypothetical protein
VFLEGFLPMKALGPRKDNLSPMKTEVKALNPIY